MKTEEDISMLTTKVCDFMDLTGISLHEIVFGLCLTDDLSVDALDKRKEAYIVKLEAICEQIEKEEKLGIPDASNAFREEQALASYLLEKLQSTFTYMVNEELDAKLASIDIAKVRALFGPEVAERQIKVRQSIFRRLADVYSKNFDNAITSVLDTEMKTEDAASAQKLFSKKQKSMEEIDKFLKETGLMHIAEALKK